MNLYCDKLNRNIKKNMNQSKRCPECKFFNRCEIKARMIYLGYFKENKEMSALYMGDGKRN